MNRYLSLVIVVLASTLGACSSQAPDVYDVAPSPAGEFQVRLLGDLQGRPRLPFKESAVALELSGKVQTVTATLYRSDWLDDAFRTEFPREEWQQRNVLRFVPATGGGRRGRLLVVNDSRKPITYLLVSAGDLFLIADVAPHQTVSLDTPVDIWPSIEGRFLDKSLIPTTGFRLSEATAAARNIEIRITESGVSATRVAQN